MTPQEVSEFDLIEKYFHWKTSIPVGIGDDAAVMQAPHGRQLVVTTDTLVSGVHFPANTVPGAIGHKALAVNLSDLAAMGADPAWFTLALTLPQSDEAWLGSFARGLRQLAAQYNIELVGGDTTKGPLSITITAIGLAAPEQLMRRDAAEHGDAIYVTGPLGDAAAGLAIAQQRLQLRHGDACLHKLDYPQPRIEQSRIIRAYANACIDISDGFLADLGHILECSATGAIVDLSAIPLGKELQDLPGSQALPFALAGGDDYELLFTVPVGRQTDMLAALEESGAMCYCVGHIDTGVSGIRSSSGQVLEAKGYNHFRGTSF